MSAPSNLEPGELAPTVGRIVDQVCNRFEEAWKAGGSPKIEDYLPAADTPECAALLVELIALAIFYRRQRGEQPSVAEYRTRFPELDGARLEKIFAEVELSPV